MLTKNDLDSACSENEVVILESEGHSVWANSKVLLRWIDYSVKEGVSVVFDAGTPKADAFHERCYKILCKLNKEGRLPVYVDGCFATVDPRDISKAVETVTRYNREYNTEHVKVHTYKMFMDGTLKIHTAAMVTPYADTNTKGSIKVGKDADYLIFDKNLLEEPHEGFTFNKPAEVYFCGKKMN